tara:strand:+ start:611 stop:1243 length:633 start_codon:yes stop_codon:yes gene_type:complete
MGYGIGTKVAWVTKYRKLKEGLKESNYNRCNKRLIDKYADLTDKISREEYTNKWLKLIDKFYYKDKFETKSGISEISHIDRLDNDLFFTLKNVKGFFSKEELTPFVKNLEMSKLLRDCKVTSSPLTRTGELYYYKNVLIMEYVTSTKNVWVDYSFLNQMTKEEQEDFKCEIRNLLWGKVKNVNELDLNNALKERDEMWNEIFKKYFIKNN